MQGWGGLTSAISICDIFCRYCLILLNLFTRRQSLLCCHNASFSWWFERVRVSYAGEAGTELTKKDLAPFCQNWIGLAVLKRLTLVSLKS